MKSLALILVFFLSSFAYGQTVYEKDFEEFWEDVNENYAYLDQQQIDWKRVKEIYQPRVKQVANDKDFIRLLEEVINEFHNGHISLNTNLSSSNRIIPSGQDVFVREIGDKYYVADLRKGFGADLSGIKIGDEVVLFNGKPITGQFERFLPKYTQTHTEAMNQYALNMLFAGTHDVKRRITVNQQGNLITFRPDSLPIKSPHNLIESKVLNPTTAYIKINNSLGNVATIAAFDQAVDSLMDYKNLVIDLTETPNGGNTTVARCMMGRFIAKTMPYQQHEFDEKAFDTQRKWVEYVMPRKKMYKGKVFVLVGHWTGSMGEGIAIGFDAIKRAKTIGTEMAGLLGAIDGFTMSQTNIGFQIPTERLYHINGTPREKYKPRYFTQNIEETMQKMKEIR